MFCPKILFLKDLPNTSHDLVTVFLVFSHVIIHFYQLLHVLLDLVDLVLDLDSNVKLESMPLQSRALIQL